MPFNNSKLNYVQLYGKEVNLSNILLKFYQVTARSSNKIMKNQVMTQFRVISLDDQAMTWRNQDKVTINDY